MEAVPSPLGEIRMNASQGKGEGAVRVGQPCRSIRRIDPSDRFSKIDTYSGVSAFRQTYSHRKRGAYEYNFRLSKRQKNLGGAEFCGLGRLVTLLLFSVLYRDGSYLQESSFQ
jgi:hypothetical protein